MPTAMEILESVRGTPLVWTQPLAFTQQFELAAGDRVLAILRWPKDFGSLAEGSFGDESWTFKRVGFWQPAVTVRRPETGEQDVGRFVMDWRGGNLVLPGGARYPWGQVSFWRADWAFFDAAGKDRLVEFVPGNQFLRMSTDVRIHAIFEGSEDLPLLLLLGWYLLVMSSQSSALAASG